MKKIKVYVIVCSYITDVGVVKIDLSKRLEQLDIQPDIDSWSVNYRIDDVVTHDIQEGHKVKYVVESRMVDDIYKSNIPFGYSIILDSNFNSIAKHLNDIKNNIFMEMSSEELDYKLRRYGFDYTKQIKGGSRTWAKILNY